MTSEDPATRQARIRVGTAALAALGASAALGGLLVWQVELRQIAVDRAQVEYVTATHAATVQRNVERALSATFPLAALVVQQQGEPDDFETLATKMLPYYQGASSLQLAPGGVVRRVVPMLGNEKAVGHDLLKDPKRDKEAFRARDTGALTLAGPFNLLQGGVAAVGRLPVYLGEAAGRREFWGFVSVLIRFPDVLKSAELSQLADHGLAFELWRTHPDTGQRHAFASSGHSLVDPVDMPIAVPGAVWTLSVAPAAGWVDPARVARNAALALLVSALLAWITALLVRDRQHRQALVTGIDEATRRLRSSLGEAGRLRAALDHVSPCVYMKGPDSRYLMANRSALELLGCGADDLIGRDDDAFFPPETAAGMRSSDRHALGGERTAGEVVVARPGQPERTFWEVKAPVYAEDGSGRVVGVVGIATDISERKRMEQALAESESRHRKLFAESGIVMLLIDPASGLIVDANQAAMSFYGYPAERLIGAPISLLNTLPRDAIDAEMARARDQGRQYFEFRHRLADGEIRDVLVSSGPIELDGKKLLLSTIQDMTERRQAEARMREALVVFTNSSQGIMTTDADGLITSINPAFSAITGFAASEVIGRSPSIFKSGRHDEAFYRAMWESISAHGLWEGEVWNRRRNGQIYPQWLTISSVTDARGRIVQYVAMFSDITERKQQEEALWRQANFDALTGLANRNLLADRLERAISQARRMGTKAGLALLDLDGFKWINDTLGHDVGDQMLIEVGQRLKSCVRDQDTIARLGGDEFTCVIHNLSDAQDMRPVAEKLVAAVSRPFTLSGNRHLISASVGITVFPDDGDDVQTLLKNADIAMYKAKQAGKNRCQFYARHMQVDAQVRMQMEADLRQALADSAFVLHYQPVVDTDSGELVAAEALIRWQHPERGMVSPLEFISVAEDCGLITPIGEWVLREAARQWAAWRDQGLPPLRLSVNVSSMQFREPHFAVLVQDVLRTFDIAPGWLVLEMTESVLMDSSQETEMRMRGIKDLGVGFALDDFGTGFSSLSSLKRFPVDIVKIDRSFINDCPDDRNDAHLVEAIVSMVHSLHLRVTAEGVETLEQYEFLRDLGCDHVQGYLAGRPLPAEQFESVIQRRLLLERDGTGAEATRFLAALRQDEFDIDHWLQRLLDEASQGQDQPGPDGDWVCSGLDLRQAVRSHLEWRRRLDRYTRAELAADASDVQDAGSSEHCALGVWIAEHRDANDPAWVRLDQAHRTFHRLAGQIVEHQHNGHRLLARRTLSGMALREASRDIVVGLIACCRRAPAPLETRG